MKEAEKIVDKLKELYPFLVEEDVGVRAMKRKEDWIVFFSKDGHEQAFSLPEDFITSCIEQGYCHLYREKCTRALGLLMEDIRSPATSAASVIRKLKELIPGLDNPEITIAVSEEKPSWTFFMTKIGASRPVEFKLPSEVVSCSGEEGCEELRKAAEVAYRCLLGE